MSAGNRSTLGLVLLLCLAPPLPAEEGATGAPGRRGSRRPISLVAERRRERTLKPRRTARERADAAGRLERRRLYLLEGEFPVRALLALYAEFTGVPVLLDSAEAALLERKVILVAPIRDADDAMLEVILDANGVALHRRRLRGGRLVTIVRTAGASDPFSEPRELPIIRVAR